MKHGRILMFFSAEDEGNRLGERVSFQDKTLIYDPILTRVNFASRLGRYTVLWQ